MTHQPNARPDAVVAGLAQRRPQDLVVGEVGRCEIHNWPTAWRTPAGAHWCERCWWQTPEGRALARYLQDLPTGVGSDRGRGTGREVAR